MPPSFSYNEERLELLLNSLKNGFNNVVEARHISWWNKTVFDEFSKRHIIFSGISYPSVLPDDTIQNTDIVYYRFHGRPVLYKSLYTKQEITTFSNSIHPEKQQVYVYFNNTWGTSAITNARELQLLK